MESSHPDTDARRFPCTNEGNSETSRNRTVTTGTTLPQHEHSASETRERSSTMTGEQTLELLDLGLSSEILCSSSYCREDLHKGSHPADWFVGVTCDQCGVWDWCNERFMIYTRDRQHGEETYCSIHLIPNIEITWWKPVRFG